MSAEERTEAAQEKKVGAVQTEDTAADTVQAADAVQTKEAAAGGTRKRVRRTKAKAEKASETEKSVEAVQPAEAEAEQSAGTAAIETGKPAEAVKPAEKEEPVEPAETEESAEADKIAEMLDAAEGTAPVGTKETASQNGPFSAEAPAAENVPPSPKEADSVQEKADDAVPAWNPVAEESFEEILQEEILKKEMEEDEDAASGHRNRKSGTGFLDRLAERKLPRWLAKLVDRCQKMELPEKVDLPKWLGPINKLNLPNQLTLLRIVLIPLMMGILYWGFPGSRYVALLVFIAASITDLLDGKIARKYNLVTDFGKFADPLADKMLVTAAMLWFVQTGRMPAWALLIVVCREFAVSGLRMLASGKDGRVIAAGWSGKVKTAATMICVILMFFPIPRLLNTICVWVITLTTLYSGVEYFLLNKDVIASI